MTLGLAMIARNAEQTIEAALTPFFNIVDHAVIVLGGESEDNTLGAAQYAGRQFRRHTLQRYPGPLDEQGRLLDFASARQLATDLLTTDWMIVVDADEVWHGVEQLPDLIADAEDRGFPLVMFPLRVGRGQFLQPRLFQRGIGKWAGPVHEYWELDDLAAQGMATDAIWIEQSKEPSSDRRGHNIEIAKRWLESNEPTPRILANLGRDLLRNEQYDEALKTLNQYLVNYDRRSRREDELFQVHYSRGAAFLRLDRFADAIQAAALALSVRPHGMAWTLMSEAALLLSTTSTEAWALADLALQAAERALAASSSNTSFWSSRDMVTTIPLKLKVRALARLGRNNEALATAELLREMGDDEGENMRRELCQKLGRLR